MLLTARALADASGQKEVDKELAAVQGMHFFRLQCFIGIVVLGGCYMCIVLILMIHRRWGRSPLVRSIKVFVLFSYGPCMWVHMYGYEFIYWVVCRCFLIHRHTQSSAHSAACINACTQYTQSKLATATALMTKSCLG